MRIALVHEGKAFLPALEGYHRFFAQYGIVCDAVKPASLKDLDRQVDWHFMGIDRSAPQPGIFRIHEYISPSTPPWGQLKDLGKRWLNVRPQLRIFKNEYVRRKFDLKDNVPFLFQDIGIPSAWLGPARETYPKEFDFIYIGDLSRQRRPSALLQAFTRPGLQNRSLLLIGRDYAVLQQEFQAYNNIIFKGPLSRTEVRQYILRSRFGLNYMPDVEPFNQLTSTKFLEYAACGLPIVSTDYAWIRQFKQLYGGNYLLVQENMTDLDWEKVISYDYQSPDLRAWTWEHQIRHSGVLEFLQPVFPEVRF